jgi:hypothetical protein
MDKYDNIKKYLHSKYKADIDIGFALLNTLDSLEEKVKILDKLKIYHNSIKGHHYAKNKFSNKYYYKFQGNVYPSATDKWYKD